MGKDEEIAGLLKVRISLGEDKNLIGSGILYLLDSKQKALVLTAAHVVDQICSTEDNMKLANFECNTLNNDIKTIRKAITKASDFEELRSGNAYVHKEYRGNLDNYCYDAAIIVVDSESWMEELPRIKWKKYEFQGNEAIGTGFPTSMDNEYKEGAEHSGQNDIKGILKNFEKGKGVHFSYNGIQNKNYKVSRDDLMKGFSGTGLIVAESSGYYFAGVVSHGAGNETKAGTEMWIAPSDFFIDIITGVIGTLPKLEVSVDIIEALNLEDLTSSNSINNKLKEQMYVGVKYGSWTREYFEANSKEFGQLYCEENRDFCSRYVEGLLKRAIIFQCLKIPITHEKNYLELGNSSQQKTDNIFLEYLCTEKQRGGIVFELIENHYFERDKYLDKSTIFIVNGKNRISPVKRRNIGGIMTDIVKDIMKLELKEFGITQEKISQAEFDIIKGRITACKMAMVAIDDLVSCMEGVSAKDEESLKGELNHLWN